MNRIASLQKRARRLSRLIFASLPFAVRFAHVFSILSYDTEIQALARALGEVFIKRKVQGLPDVGEVPALEFPIESRPLPSSYMIDFAAGIRRHLLSKVHNEELVSTAISNFILRFYAKGAGYRYVPEGATLREARNVAIRTLQSDILNEIRAGKRKKRDTDSLSEQNEEGDHPRWDPADPDASAKAFEQLDPLDMPKVRKVLEREVHPDAPMYLDLLLHGYAVTEILGDPTKGRPALLPHMKTHPIGYKNWKKTYEPKIRRVIEQFMQS